MSSITNEQIIWWMVIKENLVGEFNLSLWRHYLLPGFKFVVDCFKVLVAGEGEGL